MKKILSIFLSVMLALTANAQITIIDGDMDEDGKMTIADVTSQINDYLNGDEHYTYGASRRMDNEAIAGSWKVSGETTLLLVLNADGTASAHAKYLHLAPTAKYEYYPQRRMLVLMDKRDNIITIMTAKMSSEYNLYLYDHYNYIEYNLYKTGSEDKTYEYLQLDYLEANGGYILTDYVGKANSTYYISAEITGRCNDWGALMTVGRSPNHEYGLSVHLDNGANNWGINENGYTNDYLLSTENYKKVNIAYSTNSGIKINDFSYNQNWRQWNGTDQPLSIFRTYQNGTWQADAFPGRLYFLKITENDSTVRNFVPALRVSDSEAGVYDTINKQFFAPVFTGQCRAGSIVDLIE